MTSHVNDYGGNSYGSVRSTGLRKDRLLSMRCTECEKLRYVTSRELQRAASPRCMGCGGPLEEIVVSKKRRGVPTKKKARIVRGRTNRCAACGIAFNTNNDLYRHLSADIDCVRYHREEGHITEFGGDSFIKKTIHIEANPASTISKRYEVQAVDCRGKCRVLRAFARQYEATDWLREQFGPVEHAGQSPTCSNDSVSQLT